MTDQSNLNLDGLPMYHLRRIGKPASKNGVVSVMDFYRVTYMIGRSVVQVDFYIDSSNHIQSASLSRCHARVVRQSGNQHRLYDDSLNGVFVNNIKIAGSCVLREGDRVTFGHPCGARLPAGSRSRQPDSDNQFMFEMCSCERRDKNTGTEKKNKEASGFKEPISPAESNGRSSRKSKRAARQTTQCFSTADVRQLKKAWEDRQSNRSASETSDMEGNSESSDEQIDMTTVMDTETTSAAGLPSVKIAIATPDSNKTGISKGLEQPSRLVRGQDSYKSDETNIEELAVGNTLNNNLPELNKVNELVNTGGHSNKIENEQNKVDVSLLQRENKATKNGDTSFDDREDLKALEGTFHSIMNDLSALRGEVENEVQNAKDYQLTNTMPIKSPTKDASIQTSQCDVDVASESKKQVYVSPTKEMGIQTSQAMFSGHTDKDGDSDGDFNEIGLEITSRLSRRTVNGKIATEQGPSSVDNLNEEVSEETEHAIYVDDKDNLNEEVSEETEHAIYADESIHACIRMTDPANAPVEENLVKAELDSSREGNENADDSVCSCTDTSSEEKDNISDITEQSSDILSTSAVANKVMEKQNPDLPDVSPEVAKSDLIQTSATFEMNECTEDKDESECVLIGDGDNNNIEMEQNEKEATDESDSSDILILNLPSLVMDEKGETPGMMLSNSVEFSDNDSEGHMSDFESDDALDEQCRNPESEKESDDELKEMKTEVPTSCLSDLSHSSVDLNRKPGEDDKICYEEMECSAKQDSSEDSENFDGDITRNKKDDEYKCTAKENEVHFTSENEQEKCSDKTDVHGKRKISCGFDDTANEIERKRHCSETTNILLNVQSSGEHVEDEESVAETEDQCFHENAHSSMINDSRTTEKQEKMEEAFEGETVDKSDEELEEKGLTASQKRLKNLKKGIKRFFKFWSKKSYELNGKSASNAGYIYLKDTAGDYKLLELEAPEQISDSSVYQHTDVNSLCRNDEVIQYPDELNHMGMEQSSRNMCSELDRNKDGTTASENESDTDGKEMKNRESRNKEEQLQVENTDVSNIGFDDSLQEGIRIVNEPEGSNGKEATSDIKTTDVSEDIEDPIDDENSSLQFQISDAEVDRAESSMCQTDNEIDSESVIKSSFLLSGFKSPYKQKISCVTDKAYPNVEAFSQQTNLQVLDPSQSQSPIIAKQEVSNHSRSDVAKANSCAVQLFQKETDKEEVSSQLSCRFSDDEDCFVSPEIDFSHLDDSGDEVVEDSSESDIYSVQNDEGLIGNDTSVDENEDDTDSESSIVEVTTEQKRTENLITADNGLNKTINAKHSKTTIIDDDTNDMDLPGVKNSTDLDGNGSENTSDNGNTAATGWKPETSSSDGYSSDNGKTADTGWKPETSISDGYSSDPLENFLNQETEDEGDNESTDQETERGKKDTVDIDFDFCDSESEKETIEVSMNKKPDVVDVTDEYAEDRHEESKLLTKRKNKSEDDEGSAKKRKDNTWLRCSSLSTPQKETKSSVTPFKTPSFIRSSEKCKTPVSSVPSPEHLSSTQLMNSSQTPDLDSLTATQATRVTEQLEIKARDTSKPKASRSKAKDLLEKLWAKRRIKEEAGDDFPSSSPVEGARESTEIIYSRTENREKSQALAVLEDVDKHVNSCRSVVNKMKAMLEDNMSLRQNPRVVAWRQELTDIEKRFEFPKTVIAVVGETGSGKSSLMNALLDRRSVLPTSGIRACTAVVVEVINNTTSQYFEADIEFLQRKEWVEELQILLKDLTGLDGKVKNRQPDPTSDAYVSYCKVKAVYGRIDRFEVLSRFSTVTHWLGRVKVVKSSNPEDFRRQVEKYIETQEPDAGGQYWPIVKHVRLRMPNCDVCSSGAALVDLPGVRDSNAARDRIAKEYLKNCTVVWVVSDIHRAIDNKTAKELLGENFRRQLLMDGQYGSIAFICTKTDVITPSEIIRPLELEEKTKEHEDQISEMESEKSALDLIVSNAIAESSKLRKNVRELKKEAKELHDSLEELKNLLDSQDIEDNSQSEEKEAIQEYEKELQEKKEELKQAEDRIDLLHDEKHEATQKTLELDKKLNMHRKAIAAICAIARNEYARTEIRRDFKAGLKEMKRRAGMLNDDDEDDIYSDDDDDDIGSSAENLKVFCCSSTEYQKMKNLLTDDGPPQVFSSLEETQIPTLRHYVHEMTSIRQKQWLERLIRSVGRYVFDLQMYVCEGVDMKSGDRDRKSARSTIDTELQRFDSALAPVLLQLTSDIDGVFDGSIRQKMGEGATNATSEANDTCAKWSAPVNRDQTKDKRSGGLHWQTYRATVRRQGVYKSPTYGAVDFNEDLAEPVYRSMTIVWDRAFSGMLWKILEKLKLEILVKLKTFISDLAPRLEQLSIELVKTMRVGSILLNSASNKLTEMVAHLKDHITNKQRDISRILTPHIQSSLLPEYNTCAAESGSGMYARIKSYMAQGIDTKRFTMFDEATQQLMQHLIDLQAEIIEYVRQVCQSLIQDLRTAFEPLWELPSNTSVLRSAFQHSVIEACATVRQMYDEAGIPETDERPLVSATPQTAVSSTSTVSGHCGGFNLAIAGSSDENSLQSFENTFEREQDTAYGSVEQYGPVGVRVKTERLSQNYTPEMAGLRTVFVKQERPKDKQKAASSDESVENFGYQTLQDLQSGKSEVSPVEVTVRTTPASVGTAPKPKIIAVSTPGQCGSSYGHLGRMTSLVNNGQPQAQNGLYTQQPVSVKHSLVTAQNSLLQYGCMKTSQSVTTTQPATVSTGQNTSITNIRVPVTSTYVPGTQYGYKNPTAVCKKNAGQNVLVRNLKVPATCSHVPRSRTSATLPTTMPEPNTFLHSIIQTSGSRFVQVSDQNPVTSVVVNCPQGTTSVSSYNRPKSTPTLKLVDGKENVSSSSSSCGFISVSQPYGTSSSYAKGKKNSHSRSKLTLSQKDSIATKTPPPVVIKTEPDDRGVYGRKKYLNEDSEENLK